MDALTASAPGVDPRSSIAVCIAPLSELLVPQRNQVCVSDPLGLTVPARVAVLAVTAVATAVAVAGAVAVEDAVTVTEFSAVPLAYKRALALSGVYWAVMLSVPAANVPGMMSIVALPLASVAMPRV
jgi:acetyl-CoA acetyltransferase